MRAIFFTFSPFYALQGHFKMQKIGRNPKISTDFLLIFKVLLPYLFIRITPCQQRNVPSLRPNDRHQRTPKRSKYQQQWGS